ncbi:hypothetical protein C1141_20900 [Vibrio agarivorans]|nr:hypothetical protein C1141_20900 [Vibrio agarivorans]
MPTLTDELSDNQVTPNSEPGASGHRLRCPWAQPQHGVRLAEAGAAPGSGARSRQHGHQPRALSAQERQAPRVAREGGQRRSMAPKAAAKPRHSPVDRHGFEQIV